MSNAHLVVCGSIAIDRIMNFSGNYHELIDANKLEVLSLSVLVDSLNVSEGGIGANIAYYLAGLGEAVTLLGSVGNDALDYVNRLKGLGIDTSGVHFSALATASFNVLTDAGGNQVGGFYPGAMSDAQSLSFEPYGSPGNNTLACISAHDPATMLRQIEECARLKIRLFYDPGQQVSNVSGDDLRRGVETAEALIVNEFEMSVLTKKTGWSEDEIRTKVPVVIITHGKHGSAINGTRVLKPLTVGIAKPDKIVDPTGAGDAYRAGFLYGYLRQWDVQQCAQLGSVVASFALEQHGPQAQISREQVTQRYQQTFNERVSL